MSGERRAASYPGYALVRRLPSRRRRIFEAIETADPWRHVVLCVRGVPSAAGGTGGVDDLTEMVAAMRRMDHPGIARLVAEHRDAVAIAWVTGQRLDRVFDRALQQAAQPASAPRATGRARAPSPHLAAPMFDDADRLELAIQIAELVAHAHARGVVLRDLKPGNLWLDRSGGALRVTLVDLELARVETAQRAALGATGTWGQGQDHGQRWAEPEPAALPRRVDRRADLYALGTTLAFVFGGVPLFSRGAIALPPQGDRAAGTAAERLAARLAATPMPELLRDVVGELIDVEHDGCRSAQDIVAALRSVKRIGAGALADGSGAIELRPARGDWSDRGGRPTRAHRITTEIDPASSVEERLAIAHTCLRLGDREGARAHAQALFELGERGERAGDAVQPGALAILARAQLDDGALPEAIALLDQVTRLPDDPLAARAVLEAEVAALRPQRAFALALSSGDTAPMLGTTNLDAGAPPAMTVLRELCGAWLAELDGMSWHRRLAWNQSRPDGAAIAVAMNEVFVRACGDPRAFAATVGNPGAVEITRVDVSDRHRQVTAELADAGALADAVAASMVAVMHDPRSPAPWLVCAELLIADGRAVEALDVLDSRDLACGPGPAAERLRALAWLSLDELDLAVAAGTRALPGAADEPTTWQVLALAWLGLGHGGDAINAVRMLVATGDPERMGALLAYYASLTTDELATRRDALAADALAARPEDPDLAFVRALVGLAGERLDALHAAHPDLALGRPARLALRGLVPALSSALETAFTAEGAAHTPALAWAAGLYFLAIGDARAATRFLRDRPSDNPALAAEAFVRSADRDGLRALAPRLDDLASRVARRLAG